MARFPDPWNAPSWDGPLARGGDLSARTLLAAYSLGFFPWFNEGDPIYWWNPDPRCVLFPDDFHISARSGRKIRNSGFKITLDTAFSEIIRECAAPRPEQQQTWITPEMITAYENLFRLGYAHSIETWLNGELVGGLYGIALCKFFFGESMFHRVKEAGRAALAALVKLLEYENFLFMDCQQDSPHMLAMGACVIPRIKFLHILEQGLIPCKTDNRFCPWNPVLTDYSYDNETGRWIGKESI